MSTDQDKSGKGGGDRPVLFGPANDPLLADRIEKLTGDALDSTIARLDAFADKMFSDTSGEDPFPFGVEEEGHIEDQEASPTENPDDQEAADGLDRILDSLSAEPEPDVAAEPAITPAPKVSLRDLELQLVIGEEVLKSPTSPIGDVLARTGMSDTVRSEGGYHDPGLDEMDTAPYAQEAEDPVLEGEDPLEAIADPYDPISDVFDDPDFEEPEVISPDDMDLFMEDEEADGVFSGSDMDSKGVDPELDPLDDIFPDEDLPAKQADTSDTDASRSFGLPEPSPYGDQDGMGSLYGYEDDDDTAKLTGMRSEQETDPEPIQADVTEDWLMADQDEDADRDMGLPKMTDDGDGARVAEVSAEKTRPVQDGSALEGLITDLRWGRGAGQKDIPVREAAPEVKTSLPDTGLLDPDQSPVQNVGAKIAIPAFLRRDTGRPRLGDFSDPALTEPPAREASWREPEPVTKEQPDPDDVDLDEDNAMKQAGEAAEDQNAPRKGRKRLLAGVAILALVAMAGAGAYLYMAGPAPVRIATGPGTAFVTPPGPGAFTPAASDTASPGIDGTGTIGSDLPVFAPLDETAAGVDPVTASIPSPVPDPVIVRAPLADPIEPSLTGSPAEPDPVMDDQAAAAEPVIEPLPVAPRPTGPDAVPTEVSDLLAQISQGTTAPAPTGASLEQVDAIDSRLSDVEAITAAAQGRSVELANELTGLTDQITALLQRDSDQAERLERMERLIRGQSAILAQFGQMEESLEQTQVVLLDVSARIGAVEGKNPADRDAVNRALADIEGRLQALTANMSILARMSIEGVDTLRAPGASSGTVGVQTAPQVSGPSGGSDTVFRSETGGFRISSDAAGRIPAGVKKDDFIEGYGYVLDVLPASDGKRLVVMENGSVLVPNAE
jgi:hypothetical protein